MLLVTGGFASDRNTDVLGLEFLGILHWRIGALTQAGFEIREPSRAVPSIHRARNVDWEQESG